MKYNPKEIICPQCNRKVGTYDGRATINPTAQCKNCKKLVVYNIETRESILRPIPKRTQGSGVRFY